MESFATGNNNNNNNAPSNAGIIGKRKAEDETSDDYYNIAQAFSSKEATVDRAEIVRTILAKAVELEAKHLIKTANFLRRYVVCGPQSHGKSSFINQFLFEIDPRIVNLLPTADGTCTRKSAVISLYPSSSSKTYKIANKIVDAKFETVDGKTVESVSVLKTEIKEFDDVSDVHAIVRSSLMLDDPIVSMDAAFEINVNSQQPLKIIDTPGNRKLRHVDYFSAITRVDDSGNPVLIVVLRPVDGDIQGEEFIRSIQDTIASDLKRWNGMEMLVVVTHADTYIGNPSRETSLVRGALSVRDQTAIPVRVCLVQTGINGCPQAKPEEILQAERDLFAGMSTKSCLCDAKAKDGSPLFCFGIKNVAKLFANGISEHLAKDQGLISQLMSTCTSLHAEIDRKINLLQRNHSPAWAAEQTKEFLTRYTNWTRTQKEIGQEISIQLRKYCEKWYIQSEMKKREIVTEDDKTLEIPRGKEMEAADRAELRREDLESCLDFLADHSLELSQHLLGLFTEKIKKFNSQYADFPNLHKILGKAFKGFAKQHAKAFAAEIRYLFEKQKVLVEIAQEEKKKKLVARWPKDSIFLADAKIDSDFINPTRRILMSIVALLRHFCISIATSYMLWEKNYAHHIHTVLFTETASKDGASPEEQTKFTEERDSLALVICYCKSLITGREVFVSDLPTSNQKGFIATGMKKLKAAVQQPLEWLGWGSN